MEEKYFESFKVFLGLPEKWFCSPLRNLAFFNDVSIFNHSGDWIWAFDRLKNKFLSVMVYRSFSMLRERMCF